MANHHRQPVRVNELAKVSGLSRRGFFKAFRTHVGVRPSSLLTAVRVETSKLLLKETDLSLTEVARRSGYRNVNTFWVAFRRVTGITPGKFRRQSRRKDVRRK